eukprot:TRINITY_DN718_c1_g1_i1.p1 TRINITY_DN718_c1_g1~~TRINITY_DN718_c1_g1_i1.p1  ORF type:complete len:165 (+),score=31.15 TRINITY_DN718_c1_g1_i1:174-668(+)
MSLGSRGERVLALAELVLNPTVYDVNCHEPVIEQKYDEVTDDSCSSEDAVIICYGDDKIKVSLNAVDPDTNEPIPFEGLYFSHLMDAVEQELDNVPVATQRFGFSDYGEIDAANSFKEVGVKRGSYVYLQKDRISFLAPNKKKLIGHLEEEMVRRDWSLSDYMP